MVLFLNSEGAAFVGMFVLSWDVDIPFYFLGNFGMISGFAVPYKLRHQNSSY